MTIDIPFQKLANEMRRQSQTYEEKAAASKEVLRSLARTFYRCAGTSVVVEAGSWQKAADGSGAEVFDRSHLVASEIDSAKPYELADGFWSIVIALFPDKSANPDAFHIYLEPRVSIGSDGTGKAITTLGKEIELQDDPDSFRKFVQAEFADALELARRISAPPSIRQPFVLRRNELRTINRTEQQ